MNRNLFNFLREPSFAQRENLKANWMNYMEPR